MPKKQEINVTIKHIAEEMGVSFSTVAKALNNDPVVKEATREKVQKKAVEMGYLPNIIAKGLRSKSTKTVGVILNDIENPTRTHVVKKVSIDLANIGYTTLIFDSQYDLEIERKNVLSALSHMPDAIIISPVSVKSKNLILLKNMYDRTIILGRQITGIPTHYVHMDHRQGGYLSASTMIENGHKNNLILNDPKDAPSGIQFIEGVQNAYAKSGLKLEENRIFSFFPSIENSCNLILSLFNQEKHLFQIPFSGIIASYDILAFGVYQAAHKLRLKIPGEISIIGYDDNPIARLLDPPLSTIYMPTDEIASKCTEILHKRLILNDPEVKVHVLHPRLIVRESIRKNN